MAQTHRQAEWAAQMRRMLILCGKVTAVRWGGGVFSAVVLKQGHPEKFFHLRTCARTGILIVRRCCRTAVSLIVLGMCLGPWRAGSC